MHERNKKIFTKLEFNYTPNDILDLISGMMMMSFPGREQQVLNRLLADVYGRKDKKYCL